MVEVIEPRLLKAMSEEQLKAFLEAVKDDAGLLEQLKAAQDPDAVVAIAKAAGFVITSEQLMQLQSDLSEQELAAITGGSAGTCNAKSLLVSIYGNLPKAPATSTPPLDS